MNNPHYLKEADKPTNASGYEDMDHIQVTELDLSVPLKVYGEKRSDKYLDIERNKRKSKKKKKSKKHKKHSSSDEEIAEEVQDSVLVVNQSLELPEGATLSDSESSHDNPDDPHKALDIDLDL